MSDPNWISAANAHHPASVLSKSRTDFGVETSSRSPHFCRAINATVKKLLNATANDTRPGAGCDATASPQYSSPAGHRLAAALAGACALTSTACELDDHILQDIGLTREALLRETARPFWR